MNARLIGMKAFLGRKNARKQRVGMTPNKLAVVERLESCELLTALAIPIE